MVELRLLRGTQHQAHPAAVKKCQSRWRLEKQRQAQLVPIEGRRSVCILGVDGDLADARDSDSSCGCTHLLTSKAKLVSIANYIRWQKSSPKRSSRELSRHGRKPSRPPTAFTPPPSTCCAASGSRMWLPAPAQRNCPPSPCWSLPAQRRCANWLLPSRSSYPP